MVLNKRKSKLIRWIVIVIIVLLGVQFLMAIIVLSHPLQNYREKSSEPSPFTPPENNIRGPATPVSVLYIMWHKILLFFLSIRYYLDDKHTIYNGWNTMTQEQYYKPSNYAVSATDYPFVIKAESVCPKDKVAPHAIIVILSVWSAHKERNAIRRTWASGNYTCSFPDQNYVFEWVNKNKDTLVDFGPDTNVMFWKNGVRHVFLFGLPENALERQAALDVLEEESQKYNDIVVSNFHDTYRNLSIKSLSGLKWATTYCPRAVFVVKIDQDVYLHVPRFLQFITQAQDRNAIIGRFTDGIGSPVFRTGRYTIQYQAYPFDGGFPPHVKGGIYIIPLDIAEQLTKVAPYMPYVSVEDVYVTGILRQAVGAQATAFPNGVYYELVSDLRLEVMEYLYQMRFASHPVGTAEVITYIWNVTHKFTIC